MFEVCCDMQLSPFFFLYICLQGFHWLFCRDYREETVFSEVEEKHDAELCLGA